MEIFKFLSDIKNAEVTTNVVKENVYPELNGTISISKGIFKAEYSWYCRISTMYRMEDYISLEDFEFDGLKESIEGLEIDNFHQFRQGLIDHGMKSVAESLTINDNLIKEEIYKTIPNHKFYKALFGDKKLFHTLSIEEKQLAYVKAIREDLTFREKDNNMKRSLGWVNEEGNILSNEEILEIYK